MTAVDAPRLVVVSNRLPVVLERAGDGWAVKPGSGGLVTALAPVLGDRGGTWIGWTGTAGGDTPGPEVLDRLTAANGSGVGYRLVPVHLSEPEVEGFYRGFANRTLWPLFHDLLGRTDFEPSWWQAYQEVNRKYAEVVAASTEPGDFVWVHDYHLMLVGRALAQLDVRRDIAFFLHIPFPPPDIFMKLPWRRAVLEALLEYRILGFQTRRDRRNFLDCAQALLGETRVLGRGQVRILATSDRLVRVGAFPISIDFVDFARRSASAEVAREAWIIHANLPDRKLILGIDRLDYTKGIPERLRAFGNALQRYPELRRKVSLVQVAVPSRVRVDEYQELRREIERLVGELNGRFTEVGWVPVHYIFRALSPVELLGFYRTCEIALVTPLKDGMNLVAKEYCAASMEEQGVLILSEFAGAADELRRGALMVNPHDIEGTADAIHTAWAMTPDERRRRMQILRRQVQRHDIHHWVRACLGAADRGLRARQTELDLRVF